LRPPPPCRGGIDGVRKLKLYAKRKEKKEAQNGNSQAQEALEKEQT
jgi:hypothetical protein